jgi:malonate transporter and related proteins
MIEIFESLLPVFLVIALGAGLKQFGLVPGDMWDGLERIAYWVLFPALLIETLIHADLKSAPVTDVAAALILAAATQCVIAWLAMPLFRRGLGLSATSYTSVFQASTRWNAFIALAVVARLFGAEGLTLIAVAMAAMMPFLNVVNVTVVATYASEERAPPLALVKMVAKNPFVWSCLTGIVLNLAGVPIYEPILTATDLLGRAALGGGLLLVGGGLVLRDALKPSPAVMASAALKLIVMPLVVAGYALAFGLTGVALSTALICASVPTAMSGYVLARQMGGDAPLVAAIATVQTVAAAVTMPLVLAIVRL